MRPARGTELAPADSTFETNSLRTLARLLVRAYLADGKLAPQVGLDCAPSSKAPLDAMTGEDEP